MEYTNTVDDFSLSSTWSCAPLTSGGWTIASGPTVASAKKAFVVALPADAEVSRAWITASLGSPYSGAAYILVNTAGFGSGSTDVTGITAETTSFEATFLFKANGAVISNTNTHQSVLWIRSATLHVEYTSAGGDSGGGDEGGGDEGDDGGDEKPTVVTGGDIPGRLPRLLDANLREVTRLYPLRVSLDLSLRPMSTATVTIPWGEHEVKVRDFLELFSPDGSVGIYRVEEVDNTYGKQQKLYCEEAMVTLADSIAVGVQAMSGTFREVITAVLGAQTDERWVLGDVDLPDEYEVVYEYTYDNLYETIMDLTNMLPEGYAWERDTSVYPWVLSLKALTAEDPCEARLSRNLTNVSVSIDTSKLCTRLYPFGTGEGTDRISLATLTGSQYVDADTVDTWGIVARSFVEEDISDSLTLKSVAENYIERYKDPVVSVTLDALALYAATGERLDRFRLGRLCRLPLHAYNVIMSERVVALSFTDVYGRPDKAMVTLANRVNTVADEIGAILRETTQSKLIGGKVKTTDFKNSTGDVEKGEPQVTTFQLATYGNLLSAKMVYTCRADGLGTKASVQVDGKTIPSGHTSGTVIDIKPYLTVDDSGVPTVGDHKVSVDPTGDDWYWVHTTITLKTIEKE